LECDDNPDASGHRCGFLSAIALMPGPDRLNEIESAVPDASGLRSAGAVQSLPASPQLCYSRCEIPLQLCFGKLFGVVTRKPCRKTSGDTIKDGTYE
jgi:hypothetical protein